MLPRKLHIEQIDRYHNLIKNLNQKIDAEPDDNKKGELCLKYFKLTQLWSKIDDFIEFTLKHELDKLDQ
jgi:hypothetical protein